MNMFARFDEITAMTFQDIKEQNITDGLQHGRTDNVKTVCGGFNEKAIGKPQAMNLSFTPFNEI